MKVVRAMLVAFAALLMAAPTVAQTGYPDRPVRIIVGFTAGSATDITARMFAQKFHEAWNVPVTVENVPGAGGSVAATGWRSRRRTAPRSIGAPTAR